MRFEDIEALLNQFGYPCQNDPSKDCPQACPFRFRSADVYTEGLTRTGKILIDLEKMLVDRNEAMDRLKASESGVTKATFEDAATSAALQVHAMIIREEVWEGKRRPCFAYPDAGNPKKPRRKRS